MDGSFVLKKKGNWCEAVVRGRRKRGVRTKRGNKARKRSGKRRGSREGGKPKTLFEVKLFSEGAGRRTTEGKRREVGGNRG